MSTFTDTDSYVFHPSLVTPLPLDAYGNQEVFEKEKTSIFQPGVGLLYLTHDMLMSGAGHMRADGDDRVIVSREASGEVSALLNMCTHALRPVVDSNEFVNKSCITCPYHQWSFRRDGSLIGGRDITFGSEADMDETIQSLALSNYEVMSWNGFHFAVNPSRVQEFKKTFTSIEKDFADRGLSSHLDFSGWKVIATEDTPYNADWKAFMEVFGDCYHVPPYHDGLASFSDCDTLEWTFGENYNVQFLKIHEERGGRSEYYRRWLQDLEKYYEAKDEPMTDFAVAWAGLYPNLMIELYNGLRVISILIPTGPKTHINRLHYCIPEDMDALVPDLAENMKLAFDETGEQDFTLVETRQQGIDTAKTLSPKTNTYYLNLTGAAPEAGTAHFFEWWRHQMESA